MPGTVPDRRREMRGEGRSKDPVHPEGVVGERYVEEERLRRRTERKVGVGPTPLSRTGVHLHGKGCGLLETGVNLWSNTGYPDSDPDGQGVGPVLPGLRW